MNVILLKHFDFDDPAVFTGWAEEEGHCLTILNPTKEALDMAMLDENHLLIVGGSPASAYQDEEYPWLAAEKAFVKKAIGRGIKVFGICFGAQMLAELLGGRAYAHSVKEIGWHEVRRNETFHPALVDLPDTFRSFQWHGDTFDLPPGAVRLASSAHCSNQAYAWGDHVLAVQFHLETSQSCIATMLDVWEQDLRRDEVTVQSAEAILLEQERTAESFDMLRGILSRFAGSPMPADSLEKK